MENIELYKAEVNEVIKEITLSEKIVTIRTDTKTIGISANHDQDCCENVYADFEIIKYHLEALKEKRISGLVIKGVSGMGFLLCLAGEKIFVPCYNSQNGYYSSELELEVEIGDVSTTVDISSFVEDDIE